MITEQINDRSKVIWQEWSGDSGGEPAILITKYDGSVEINQEGKSVLISQHELKAFIKELKALVD